MTRRSALVLAAALAGAGSVLVTAPAYAAGQRPVASAAARAGTWASARELAGVLNKGGYAGIASVSCASAGNCAAGGFYEDSLGQEQPLLASEVSDAWQPAVQVPGIAALNLGRSAAQVTAVSCPTAGNCTAVGFYSDASSQQQVFVTAQVSGTWGPAQEIPGTAALNLGGNANIFALSCRAATTCSGGGTYSDSAFVQQALVITEASGVWSSQEVGGALNVGNEAQINSVSCSGPGNCGAGGYYSGKSGFGEAFVVSQSGGTWGAPKEVPGTGALNKLNAQVAAISCASAGNCTAGGNYGDSAGDYQAFVTTESGGVWATATQAPGTGGLNKTGSAMVTAIACHAAGNCSAGGYYSGPFHRVRPFLISEVKGAWISARETASQLNTGDNGAVTSVSCGSAGNCTVGGYYLDRAGNQQAFEVGQSAGRWSSAAQVPGTRRLNAGGIAALNSVSCAAPGVCVAGGYYTDKSGREQAFVANET